MWVPSENSKRSPSKHGKKTDELPTDTNENSDVIDSADGFEVPSNNQNNISDVPLKPPGTFDLPSSDQTSNNEHAGPETSAPSEVSNVNPTSDPCLRSFKLFVVRDVIKTMTQRHEVL